MTNSSSVTRSATGALPDAAAWPSGMDLLTVPAAPGGAPVQADTIRQMMHAPLAPKTAFEELLVEEIADLTRRMRQDEYRIGRILRTQMRDLIESELYRGHATLPEQAGSVGSPQRALAEAVLAACGIEIEAIETRAWLASSRAIDQFDRQIAGNRRQRTKAIEDLEALRTRARQAAIPDAEEISE
ncbi:hypothetical protein [Rhodovulum marinum]|uniref:Uncharacterized protein n=1 Tax=Rhodovulum marinum TaxID=320662 RepID=A0A4R2Q124_9RHOB|nr:hypothetical protein [Rhodovulum marinum]TCP41268.1 hypothetical protein EV662_10512 [Rhodovulum marinum]